MWMEASSNCGSDNTTVWWLLCESDSTDLPPQSLSVKKKPPEQVMKHHTKQKWTRIKAASASLTSSSVRSSSTGVSRCSISVTTSWYTNPQNPQFWHTVNKPRGEWNQCRILHSIQKFTFTGNIDQQCQFSLRPSCSNCVSRTRFSPDTCSADLPFHPAWRPNRCPSPSSRSPSAIWTVSCISLRTTAITATAFR